MAAKEERSTDYYGVMGLEKECTPSELRNAYKKLAMRWHPDKCNASGNPKYVEEAKKKFQDIQQAYSVLSDANKRLLYDVGVYDSDDADDQNGMGDFLSELAAMMNQNKSNGKRNQTFEDLQELFHETFHGDNASCSCASSSQDSCGEKSRPSNKRTSSEMSSRDVFCSGEDKGRPGGSRRDGRKQKISPGQDVSHLPGCTS